MATATAPAVSGLALTVRTGSVLASSTNSSIALRMNAIGAPVKVGSGTPPSPSNAFSPWLPRASRPERGSAAEWPAEEEIFSHLTELNTDAADLMNRPHGSLVFEEAGVRDFEGRPDTPVCQAVNKGSEPPALVVRIGLGGAKSMQRSGNSQERATRDSARLLGVRIGILGFLDFSKKIDRRTKVLKKTTTRDSLVVNEDLEGLVGVGNEVESIEALTIIGMGAGLRCFSLYSPVTGFYGER